MLVTRWVLDDDMRWFGYLPPAAGQVPRPPSDRGSETWLKRKGPWGANYIQDLDSSPFFPSHQFFGKMSVGKYYYLWTSLVAQWLRIRLPMQGTRVRALVREDPTCHGATKPVRHNYWTCTLEPVLCNKRSQRKEKPAHRNEDPTQPKINK